MPTDGELKRWIAGAKEGREEAFEAIVRHYWGSLSRIVGRFTTSGDDEDEWIELILLHALDQIMKGRFRFISAASFHSWLLCIAGNKCIEFWRRAKRRQETAMDGEKLAANPDPNAVIPIEEAERFELRKAVVNAINQISKKNLRETISMVWCQGLSIEEIAAKLEKPINTIRTWERRGKIALREILERKYPDIVEEFGVD